TPEGAARPAIRTYTLSSVLADPCYRISVKREDPAAGRPAGAVSTHLHRQIKVGDLIDTRAPNGQFWIDTDEKRPAVLIAGGVGITPMIAMARQAVSDGFARRNLRPLTIFHSAQTTAHRAFAADFIELQQVSGDRVRYVSLIDRPAAGEKAGRDFDWA